MFNFDDFPVFSDATTYPLIMIIKNSTNLTTFDYSEINKREKTNDPINVLESKKFKVNISSLGIENWSLVNIEHSLVLDRITQQTISLKEKVSNKIFRGVSTGKNEVFIINEKSKNEIINNENIENIRKIVTGKEVKRYSLIFDKQHLLYIPWDYDIEKDNSIKDYLSSNFKGLSNRPEVREGRFNWWCLSRYGSNNAKYLFEPKIIYPRINKQCNFYLDEKGEYSLSDNNFFISSDSKYLLALLNSSVVFFFLKSLASTLQGGYYDFRRPFIEKIPIKDISLDLQKPFIDKVDKILVLNSNLQSKISKFTNFIKKEYNLEKLNKKLDSFFERSFDDFIKELKKVAKLKPATAKEKMELNDYWEEMFEEFKKDILVLKSDIDRTDREIDKMVYELYELTDDEIAVVEG